MKYKDNWYDTTISAVFDSSGSGKTSQVRYNPLPDTNGDDPFFWNTEWFDSKTEAERFIFNGQFRTYRNKEGEDILKMEK